MDTDTKQDKVSIAFINDKSPIIDKICTDLLSAKFEILFQTQQKELFQAVRCKGFAGI